MQSLHGGFWIEFILFALMVGTASLQALYILGEKVPLI